MIVTSGYRTEADQKRIYSEKGQAPKMGSLHLMGGAADISDPKGELKEWLLEHLEALERLDLYCEAFDATPGWVHLQVIPPASGKRFFLP
jgi:hypothetical protein